MQTPAAKKSLRSVNRALRVLQTINNAEPLSMTEISKRTNLSYATTFRIVNTFVSENIVYKIKGGTRYGPTALALSLSCGYDSRLKLIDASRDPIVDLTEQSGWPVTVSARSGLNMVVQDATHALTTMTFSEYMPGYALPILSSASGLAYLSALPVAQRSRLLEHLKEIDSDAPMSRIVQSSSDAFFDRINELGYACFIKNQHTKDPGKTSSIAMPIVNHGEVFGSIVLIFFSSAMTIAEAYDAYGTYMHTAQERIQNALPSRDPN